jgi:hypothetical protein
MDKKELKELLLDFTGPEAMTEKDFAAVNDMDKLMSYHEMVAPQTETIELIETRMKELLADVSVDTVPEWFIEMVKNKTAPKFLETALWDKAKELFQQL